MSQSYKIGFLLWPGLTQLDLTGPVQVLSRMPGAELFYVWQEICSIPSDCGLSLLPTHTFADCPPLDMLCVPGGTPVQPVMENPAVLAWLRQQAATADLITSVCTGSLILAAAGLLTGYDAGCHWASGHFLSLFGASFVTKRVVIDRNRITAGGVTSGIDFAFHVIAEKYGTDVTESIQLTLEYDPEPVAGGTPATARPEILASVREKMARILRAEDQQLVEIARKPR